MIYIRKPSLGKTRAFLKLKNRGLLEIDYS